MGRVLAWLIAVVVSWAPASARADDGGAVALLPLDAEKRLELYGQPVASEIARALVAGSIDVVVVGPKMAVPERARLIVDGNIAAGKGDAVVLTIRLRNAVDGFTLATMQSTAPTLAAIDQAAADLSARVLPAVREQLVAIARPTPAPAPTDARPARPRPTAAQPRPILVAISARHADAGRLTPALTEAVAAYAVRHARVATTVEPGQLLPATAAATVKASGNDLAIAFEVLGYSIRGTSVPLARARVRVRISDAVGVVFDRVLLTDTVVGDKDMPVADVSARVAREVVDIMRPHVARTVVGWK